MADLDGLRLSRWDMVRQAPMRTFLLTVVPILIGAAQLVISMLTELSFLVSVPFAIVLVGVAIGLDQYHFARYRRITIERDVFELAR